MTILCAPTPAKRVFRLMKYSHYQRRSHHTAFTLSALLQVPFFLLLAKSHTLPALHALDFHTLLARAMIPSQSLNKATIHIINANGPSAATDLNCGAVMRKMEFGEKDFSGYILRSRLLAIQRERKGCVTEIET